MNSKYTSLAADAVQWRQRHSRMTWAILGVVALFFLTFLFHDEALDHYYGQDEKAIMLEEQPLSLEHAGQKPVEDNIDIAPKDLRRAINRSEQLWNNNVKKRRDFIKAQGGLGSIREFADKAHGWGQAFTLVSCPEHSVQ